MVKLKPPCGAAGRHGHKSRRARWTPLRQRTVGPYRVAGTGSAETKRSNPHHITPRHRTLLHALVRVGSCTAASTNLGLGETDGGRGSLARSRTPRARCVGPASLSRNRSWVLRLTLLPVARFDANCVAAVAIFFTRIHIEAQHTVLRAPDLKSEPRFSELRGSSTTKARDSCPCPAAKQSSPLQPATCTSV